MFNKLKYLCIKFKDFALSRTIFLVIAFYNDLLHGFVVFMTSFSSVKALDLKKL